MELQNIWRQYFLTHNDNDVLNQNLSTLKSSQYIASNLDSCQAIFGANPDIVITILSSISKKMKLFHSVTNIGGSLTVPGNQMVELVGIAEKAVHILFSNESIGTNLNITGSFVKYIQLVRNEADFDSLELKPSEKHFGASFVLLSPFQTKVAIEIADNSLAILFTEFIVAVVIFDRENPSQDESVWTESGSILQCFWVVNQNLIQDAVFESTDDEKADTWQELRSSR